MTISEIAGILNSKIPEIILGEDTTSTPNALLLKPENLEASCVLLRDHDQLYFDMLSCITGIDNGPEANIEMVYNLYSVPHDLHLMIKTAIDRSKPEIDSVSNVWRTADWHERECYDLLGIVFTNHPDLRRILLPEDWEGYPLRKDYNNQTYYHGMKVEY